MTEASSSATRLPLGVDASPEVALVVHGWWRPALLVQGEVELARAEGEAAIVAGISGVLADGRRVSVRLRSGAFSGYRYERAVSEEAAPLRWEPLLASEPPSPLGLPGRLLVLFAALSLIGLVTGRTGLDPLAVLPAAVWVVALGVSGVAAMRGSWRGCTAGGMLSFLPLLAVLALASPPTNVVVAAALSAGLGVVAFVGALKASEAARERPEK